jgi:hypothetical protein
MKVVGKFPFPSKNREKLKLEKRKMQREMLETDRSIEEIYYIPAMHTTTP